MSEIPRPPLTPLGLRPYPQVARVPGEIPEALWTEIVRRVDALKVRKLTKPEDLVTPALFVDAKFNNTRNLHKMLSEDNAHWLPMPSFKIADR